MKNFIQSYPGHCIWSLNLHTKEILVVKEYEKLKGGIVSVEKDPVCWYCSALNEEAAIRKFNARAKRYYQQVKSAQ